MGDFSFSGGVEVTGFISPTDTTDTYPVIDTLYGIDGLRNVNNLTQLNAIPNERRRSGMLVGVSGGTQYYKLNSSPWSGTTDDWSIFNSGGGTFTGNTSATCISELWVSSISGCSPVTISEANFPEGISVNNLPLLSQTQVKVSLTTAQLKTAFTIPIDAGIAAPGAGKAIIVTNLLVNLTVGMVESEEFGMVPDPFNFTKGNLKVQLSGATNNGSGAQFVTDAILNNTEFLPDMFVNGYQPGSYTPSIFPNSILHITTESDATSGTGSAVVYITYNILDI